MASEAYLRPFIYYCYLDDFTSSNTEYTSAEKQINKNIKYIGYSYKNNTNKNLRRFKLIIYHEDVYYLITCNHRYDFNHKLLKQLSLERINVKNKDEAIANVFNRIYARHLFIGQNMKENHINKFHNSIIKLIDRYGYSTYLASFYVSNHINSQSLMSISVIDNNIIYAPHELLDMASIDTDTDCITDGEPFDKRSNIINSMISNIETKINLKKYTINEEGSIYNMIYPVSDKYIIRRYRKMKKEERIIKEVEKYVNLHKECLVMFLIPDLSNIVCEYIAKSISKCELYKYYIKIWKKLYNKYYMSHMKEKLHNITLEEVNKILFDTDIKENDDINPK